MAEQSESQIQNATDSASPPASYPFATERTPEHAVISSLDGRPDLMETTQTIIAESRVARRRPTPAPAGVSVNAPSTGPKPTLVIRTPGGTMETRHVIDVPRFLIGRENCDLELTDRFVARWHVQLFERDGALVLQDFNSRNGVYLRIADDLALEDGDQIVVGEQRFEFRTTWDNPNKQHEADPDVLGASWAGAPARLIRYIEGDQIGGVYPLGQRMTVGARNADLCFAEDSSLTSPHAVFRREQDRFFIRDLDSESGTFIRIADAVELIDGDCFLVGRTRIRLTFS